MHIVKGATGTAVCWLSRAHISLDTSGVSEMVGLAPLRGLRNGRPWTNLFKELLNMGALDPAPLFLVFYLAKLPFLRFNQIEPSNAFSLKDMQLPLEWLRLVSDQGRVCPDNCRFHHVEGFWVSYNLWTRGCSPSSYTWTGGLSRCLALAKVFFSPTYGEKAPACCKLFTNIHVFNESCR